MQSEKPRILMSRSFFGKGSCCKLVLYSSRKVFFHLGREEGSTWTWKKVKLADHELGEILLVLEGRLTDVRFYHSFTKDNQQKNTQISANKNAENVFFLKVAAFSKSFSQGEQKVMAALISHFLVRMNLVF